MLLSISPDAIPRSAEVGIDSRVLLLATAIAAATGLVFALAPVLHLGSAAIATAIRDGTNRSTPSIARRRVRHGLVVGEVALAVMLVVGASLLVRSFKNLTSVDAGFDPRPLLTFGVNLPAATYQGADRRLQFVQALDQAIRTIPDVEEVATVSGLPPKRPPNPNLTDLENIPPEPGMPGHSVDYNTFAGLGYLDAIRLPITRGRGFTAADAAGAPVVVINQAMAKRFFPSTDPIGKRLRPTPPPSGAPDTASWFTIIGVAKDVKQGGLDLEAGTELYYPLEQVARINGLVPPQFNVVVRSRRNVGALASAVERAVRSIDPSLPVIAPRSMGSIFDETLSRQRLLLTLLGIFAAVALSLAAVGTYGVLSYLVTQRRSEIGIRVALGASAGGIVRLVLREAFTMTMFGLLLGMGGAIALAGVTRSLLFGVSPTDPATYVTVASVIAISAMSASLAPAFRALRIDPLVAIRGE
jgi:putative ABC transport system permease protein